MNCNHKDTAVSLLHAVPNALRGLHDAFGFDFEQPFTVLHSVIGFTVNKIQKALQADGLTADSFAALLVYDKSRPCWRVATLNHGKVKAVFERYEFPRWYELGYEEPFDDFCTKGSFEELRKAGAEVYVIAQDRTHLRKQEAKPIDYTARYRVIDGEWAVTAAFAWPGWTAKGTKSSIPNPLTVTVKLSTCQIASTNPAISPMTAGRTFAAAPRLCVKSALRPPIWPATSNRSKSRSFAA